jgi:serine protease SohB
MACVANKIIAAPFAIIGSIGVLAQVPNFSKVLKKHDVDYEEYTAGEYKRTVTLFGENTREAKEKFQEELNDIHVLFQDFVLKNRPGVDLAKVATGEHWPASRARDLNLVDELKTSDDYLLEHYKQADLYQIHYIEKKPFAEKVGLQMQALLDKIRFG